MARNLCNLDCTLLAFFFLALCVSSAYSSTLRSSRDAFRFDPLVRKESRRTLAETEFGKISAVDVEDGYRGPYHLRFITLEPNSLFLPVLLQTDMVLYVHTGSGTLAWTDDSKLQQLDVVRGDIYHLPSGSVFHVKSHVEPTRERLRIFAFFTRSANENVHGSSLEAYSTLTDLILGFNKEILQMAFNVPDDVIEEIKKAGKPPQIVPVAAKNETEQYLHWKETIIDMLTGRGSSDIVFNKKTPKTFNLLNKKPDFENCNGRSVSVNPKDFRPLRRSGIGMFMVNLTKGSMMGPHWNARATETTIVTEGRGIVRVVCSSDASAGCNSTSIRVQEGDVFLVPRYHPMVQISFNNESLVFVGFSTMAKKNYPQFLAGKLSVFRTLSEDIVAMSLSVSNATAKRLVGSQADSIVLDCTSCAEAEEKRMEEEKQRQREEERKREEDEARRKEEEERKKREEEARRREEEEQKKREEEAAKRREEEEQKKREEEAARRREEEKQRKREEEEARRKEEKEQRKREEEEEQRKREEEEEQRKREEEEAREEEEQRKREEEQEQRKREEEEEQRKREEEEEQRKREEEEAREEEEQRKREEEEARRREEEEQMKRQEEEARRREEQKAQKRQEGEEEAKKREEEEEEQRRQEHEEQRRREEEAEEEREQEAGGGRRGDEEGGREVEEEEEERARRSEEEAEKTRKQGEEVEEEEARRKEEEERGGGGGRSEPLRSWSRKI